MVRQKKGKSSEDLTKEQQAQVDAANTTKEAFELVRLRNFFYRDNYRRLVLLALLLLILALFLAYWVYYLLTHRPAPKYFATNIQGALTQLVPMNKPSVSTPDLVSWSARAASSAFTFNYVQYKEQLQQVKNTYFTPSGGNQYESQFISTNNLQTVLQGKYVITSQPNGAPEVLWQGIVPSGTYKGVYGWRVRLPLLLTAQNCTNINKRFLEIIMTIVRSSALVDTQAINMDGTKGIGIGQILVRPLMQSAPVIL